MKDLDQPQRKLAISRNSIDTMELLKIGNVVLCSITLLWTIALLVFNWKAFVYLWNHPTVAYIFHFGACTILMAAVLLLLVGSIVLMIKDSLITTAWDDILAVIVGMAVVILVIMIPALIWAFKVLTVGLALSILLTFFYPLASMGVTFYIIYVRFAGEISYEVIQPTN